MNLLDPTYFHTNCDYSFGDQSGYQNGIVTIKNANVENFEFLSKVQDVINSGKNYMTLFIDNIRLYKRDNIKYTAKELVDDTSRKFKDDIVKEYFSKNDLASSNAKAVLKCLEGPANTVRPGIRPPSSLPDNATLIIGTEV